MVKGAVNTAAKPVLSAGQKVLTSSSNFLGFNGANELKAAYNVATNVPISAGRKVEGLLFSGNGVDLRHGGRNTILFRKANISSASLNKLAEPIDQTLIYKLKVKGWKIEIAKPGSDDLKWLNYNNADACINSGVPKHILIRDGATKSALLEEVLHAKQIELGMLEKYGSHQALEVHVKDFMLRHAEMLGINNKNDIALLQQLKIEEICRLNKL